MAPACRFSLAQVLILLCILIQLIHTHHLPVFMWSSEGESTLTSLLPLNHVSNEQFSKDYMKPLLEALHKTPVVVFVQDRLSLEDLNTHGTGLTTVGQNFAHLQHNLDENPSLVLPSIEDPFQAIRQVKSHKVIDTLDYNEDIRHKLSATRSELTVVYLPSTVGVDNRPEALKANDELMSKAVGHFGKKNFIAIFTGKEPSWDAAAEEAAHLRIARSLLQAEQTENKSEAAATVTATTDYIKAFASSLEVRIEDPDDRFNVTNETLSWPPSVPSSAVFNDTIQMVWDFKPEAGLLKSFSLKLTFEKLVGYWQASQINATFTKNTPPGDQDAGALNPNYPITAGNGFSFSCGKTILKSKKSDERNYTLYLTFYNLQLEPFSKSNSSNDSFSDSFHCSTFFTLPIWMGFFTVLLFTAILGLGILMLFQVKTMDRFDDPKGKTITVLQTE